ncbi:hypothetical protein [Achromobacter xylosoxidans]|uniref:hypothetical protein n=1 Tax=Alcaligenes xylosoxydans xylosoxydans TaxID=85698 RepID=UPI001F1495AC|nr:hypothetical protein [Achromobacter xylosoxidans]
MRPKLYPSTTLQVYLAGLEPSNGNAQSDARSGVANGRPRERRSAQLQASFSEPNLKLKELRLLEAQGFVLDTTHDQFDDGVLWVTRLGTTANGIVSLQAKSDALSNFPFIQHSFQHKSWKPR